MLNQEELLQKKELIEGLTENFKQAERDTIVLKTKIESAEAKSEELQKECWTKFACDPSELPQLISKTSDEIESLVNEIQSAFGNVTPTPIQSQDTAGFTMFENKGDVPNAGF